MAKLCLNHDATDGFTQEKQRHEGLTGDVLESLSASLVTSLLQGFTFPPSLFRSLALLGPLEPLRLLRACVPASLSCVLSFWTGRLDSACPHTEGDPGLA